MKFCRIKYFLQRDGKQNIEFPSPNLQFTDQKGLLFGGDESYPSLMKVTPIDGSILGQFIMLDRSTVDRL